MGPHAMRSLVLMTYHGGVLLLSGYQANEDKILSEYQIIVDQCVLSRVISNLAAEHTLG